MSGTTVVLIWVIACLALSLGTYCSLRLHLEFEILSCSWDCFSGTRRQIPTASLSEYLPCSCRESGTYVRIDCLQSYFDESHAASGS